MEWRKLFWINVIFAIPCTFVYMIWASGEVQDWNDKKINTDEDIKL